MDLDSRSRTSLRPDSVTWLTIYLVVLFAIPSRLVVGPLGSAGTPSMLLGLASIGAWLLMRLGAWRQVRTQINPLGIAMLCFLFSVCVSYALAMSRPIISDEVSPADVAILSLLSWSGTLLLARDIPSRDRLQTLVWRVAIAGGLVGLLGMAQFVTRRVLIDVISIPGLISTRDSFAYFRDSRIRPSGTAIHPLEYGVILTILLPIALHVAFHHRTRPLVVRWFPAIALGGVIAISSSRTTYLAALVGIAICMLGWTARQRKIVIGLTVGGLLALVTVIPRLFTSIFNLFTGLSDDPSITSRTDSFTIAWHFLAQHPLFGRGLGTLLPRYRIFDNQYLLLLVSTGVIGTALFVGFLLTALLPLIRVRRIPQDNDTHDLAVSLIASIVAGALSLAFFDMFSFPMTMGCLFLIIGIGGALSRQVLTTAEMP